MLKILAAYDIPERLVNAIMLIYKDLKAKVVSLDGYTDYFKILAGVMQGDALVLSIYLLSS